jgi:hypothetical protein
MVPNIYGIRLVSGKVALIPVISSRGMTYANVVSVPAEKHNWYIFTYITTYPPIDTRVFNAAQTSLHTLQERIHVLRKWPQGIPRSLLTVIKCRYLLPTYLHFIQDIEGRCLLLMSSTSFVDLPFQGHRMMEKHHIDQYPCISSLCPK